MSNFSELDRKFVWHPFTQMQDWMASDPIVITSGQGAVLTDSNGRDYLDANSSIWTNLHGHNHPGINAAITNQLSKVAHTSALGLANEPASLLAEKLIQNAVLPESENVAAGNPALGKVFFSDNGSTAVEVALKLSYVATRRAETVLNPRFLSLAGAYHGDTAGAVSLGHIDLFHQAYSGLLFKTDTVMAPYCYRCPYNRAEPERADAREYRKCNFECVDLVAQTFATAKKEKAPISALVIEPIMQGAAGMIPQPQGWLHTVAEIARSHDAHLIADEVMTGFGRTGSLFGCHQEGVQPDFMALAKGMTGGYLPMAATLTTEKIFAAFLGDYAEFKTFFHGHSFTGNQLGAAASLASLELLMENSAVNARRELQTVLADELKTLWTVPAVGDIRQAGLIAGIELVKDWRTRQPFDLREQAGIRVCTAMSRKGVLTRPIGNVIVLMPPYCTTPKQLKEMVAVMAEAIGEVLPPKSG